MIPYSSRLTGLTGLFGKVKALAFDLLGVHEQTAGKTEAGFRLNLTHHRLLNGRFFDVSPVVVVRVERDRFQLREVLLRADGFAHVEVFPTVIAGV